MFTNLPRTDSQHWLCPDNGSLLHAFPPTVIPFAARLRFALLRTKLVCPL